MAQEASEVRVVGDGIVYLGAVGATFPTNISSAVLSTQFVNLGYVSPEGPRFTFGRETKDIEVWQSNDPVRTIVTKEPRSAKFKLMQTNRHSLLLALGGGDITEPSVGNYLYEPAEPGQTDEHAVIFEGTDDDYTYRICYRRGQIQGAVDFSWVRDDAVSFEIDMKFLQPDSAAKPFFIQTDDPNFLWAGAAS